MKNLIKCLFAVPLLLVSCEENEIISLSTQETSLKEIPVEPPIYVNIESLSNSIFMKSKSGKAMEVFLYKAEYLTAGNSEEVGNTIFFNNRGNKQVRSDFIVDPWYLDLIDGTNDISYYVDNNRPPNNIDVAVSNAAIDRAMNTWGSVNCSSGLNIIERPYDSELKTGVVAGVLGFGDELDPIYGWVADVLHAGWLPKEFFDAFSDGRGDNIIGVTFTYITPWDLDNNGKPDVWFKEIYYNDHFAWNDDGHHIDIETVALHETGHGLSQAHFGKAFANKGGVHFSPRAVMNASYTGIQTSIEKTDNAGHCSLWENWPYE